MKEAKPPGPRRAPGGTTWSALAPELLPFDPLLLLAAPLLLEPLLLLLLEPLLLLLEPLLPLLEPLLPLLEPLLLPLEPLLLLDPPLELRPRPPSSTEEVSVPHPARRIAPTASSEEVRLEQRRLVVMSPISRPDRAGAELAARMSRTE